MTNLSQQQVSAGAASTGLFAELAVLSAKQRSDLRDVMQTGCTIQGQATIADGTAQQNALMDEAKIRGEMANQSIADAVSTGSSEVCAFGIERAASRASGASKVQTNLDRAEALEKRFNGVKTTDMIARQRKAADEVKPLAKAKSADTSLPDEMKNYDLKLTHENGEMKDLGDGQNRQCTFSKEDMAAIDHAIANPDDKKSIALRKQVTKAVKRYQKQSDSISGRSDRFGRFTKDVVHAANASAKAYIDSNGIKATQEDEAQVKFLEAQARYLSDTNGSLLRQEGEAAGSLTQHIQNINQARKEMFESNRA